MKRSKVTDYAALTLNSIITPLKYHVFENIMVNGSFALLEQMLHFPYYFTHLTLYSIVMPLKYHAFENIMIHVNGTPFSIIFSKVFKSSIKFSLIFLILSTYRK